jgi:membrane associated rhomboid family serine protease
MQNDDSAPFNVLPAPVLAVAVVIFGLEVMFQLASLGFLGGQGGVGWRLNAVRDYAVFNDIAAEMWRLGVYPPEQMVRFLTYPLIHGGMIHAVFVCAFVLALGKMVSEAFSPLAFVAIFVGSCLAGALGFVLLLDSPVPLIGGFPGAYGLIGAFTFILWVRAGLRGDSRYRAFGLIAVLLAVQLGFGIFNGEFGNVVAEMSGFAAGFLLSFVVSPGGWRRVLEKLRAR